MSLRWDGTGGVWLRSANQPPLASQGRTPTHTLRRSTHARTHLPCTLSTMSALSVQRSSAESCALTRSTTWEGGDGREGPDEMVCRYVWQGSMQSVASHPPRHRSATTRGASLPKQSARLQQLRGQALGQRAQRSAHDGGGDVVRPVEAVHAQHGLVCVCVVVWRAGARIVR